VNHFDLKLSTCVRVVCRKVHAKDETNCPGEHRNYPMFDLRETTVGITEIMIGIKS